MPDEAAAFDALADEFFSVWFRFHPDAAAAAGVRGFEGLLPAQGDQELAALGAWLESLVVALEELDYAALDEARCLDLRLMFGAARVEHRELLDQDWRHRDPARFLPLAEIYQLVMRRPSGPGAVPAALLERLPGHLDRALSRLREVPQLIPRSFALSAADEAERGHCWLRSLAPDVLSTRSTTDAMRLSGLVEAAGAALDGFARALREEIAPEAAGPLGCGGARLAFLMRHRHFVELDPDRARAVLTQALDSTATEIANLAAPPHAGDGQAVPPGERMEAARRESDRIRACLADTGILSVPDAPLHILEQVRCPRLWRPGTGYLAAEADGILHLSPPAVAEFAADLRAQCFEGGWGGAHLLAFAGGAQARRLPRRLCAGKAVAGAWALYLEDRLHAAGCAGSGDRLHALRRRAATLRLALSDLALNLSPLVGPDVDAGPDLVVLARRPGDALATALGWDALTRARAGLDEAPVGAVDERAFHDRLLSRGAVPIALGLCAELGRGRWREVCAAWADPTAVCAA